MQPGSVPVGPGASAWEEAACAALRGRKALQSAEGGAVLGGAPPEVRAHPQLLVLQKETQGPSGFKDRHLRVSVLGTGKCQAEGLVPGLLLRTPLAGRCPGPLDGGAHPPCLSLQGADPGSGLQPPQPHPALTGLHWHLLRLWPQARALATTHHQVRVLLELGGQVLTVPQLWGTL